MEKLFNDDFIKVIRRARELNNKPESKDKDIYYHPTERRIVPKSIDLTSQKPMGKFGGKNPTSSSEERWLEAYLIRQAKKNGWVLELAGKKYRFLSSQLTFRRNPSLGIGKRQHRHLDLMLYDEKQRCLVVLELKVRRQLQGAKDELDAYNEKIGDCISGIQKAFELNEIKGVVSYIVWPSAASRREDMRRQDLDASLGNHGLIEYAKKPQPWEEFKKNVNMKLEFHCIKEPAALVR